MKERSKSRNNTLMRSVAITLFVTSLCMFIMAEFSYMISSKKVGQISTDYYRLVTEENSVRVSSWYTEQVANLNSHVFALEQMGVEASVNIAPKTENGILVTLEGPKLGALIGHRGETLDAIQQLTNYAVNRGRTHRVRIHIDAENYRAKREESLKRLAEKVAAKVVKYRRNITLEPMNAYERHVIHETLQDYPNVITYSTGTEPNRRTVVAFSRGKHAY